MMRRWKWLAIGLAAAAWPALGEATRTAESFVKVFFWRDTLIGLLVIQLLMVMSVASVAMIIRNLIRFRRGALLPGAFYQRVRMLMAQKDYALAVEAAAKEQTLLGRLTRAAVEEAPHGYAAMEAAVSQAAEDDAAQLVRSLEYLNVMGNLGPMLGLFGTVYGMIVAFEQLVAAGGRPDPAQLASGISTSLVTTFWGLVVAIPALAAHALFRSRIESLASEGVQMVQRLIAPLRPADHDRRKIASAGPSSSPGNQEPR